MEELLILAKQPVHARDNLEVAAPPPLCEEFDHPDMDQAIQAHQVRFRVHDAVH